MVNLLLYHYSDKDLTVISPLYHGTHNHTPSVSLPCSYYYPSIEYREKFFSGARFRYHVLVDDNKLYDVSKDYLGLFIHNDFITCYDFLIKAGLVGIRFRQNDDQEVIGLFVDAIPIQKESLLDD